MKRLVSIALTLAVMLSLSVTAFALPFSDVSEKSWYYEDVKWVYDESKKLMSGYPDGMFRPDDNVTRAELVKVLHSLAGSPEPYGSKALPFTDIRENAWYTDGLIWAYKNGIINGKSSTRFAPNDHVTRAELAAMIFRYVTEKQLKVEYVHSDTLAPDYNSIPDYAKLAAVFLYRTGLLKGKNGGVFDPKAVTTRAETASLLRRMVTTVKKQDMSLVSKHGLYLHPYAYLDLMPHVTINGAPLPASEFYIVGVDLLQLPDSKMSSDIKATIDLKISPFSGTVEAETVLSKESWRLNFRVEDEVTLLALDMTVNSFLVFEYTITINGESEAYMSYVTVDAAY